jgi:hypothetical protein
MIDTLLGKVSGLFEKDYLFASLLPVLIFVPAVVVTFAYAIGFEGIWAWIDAWTPLEKTVIVAVVSFVVVILAYVVQGMRPAFAHFWSGDSPLLLAGLGPIAELQRQREYRRRRDATAPTKEWAKLRGTLEDEVGLKLKSLPYPTRKPGLVLRWKLKRAIRKLSEDPKIAGCTVQALADAYAQYAERELETFYASLKATLTDRAEIEEGTWKTEHVALDREFGSFATIRATQLGNVIASYNQYAAKRYEIETSVFWPRLRKVISSEYNAIVQEPRILLDFALTMSSLALVYAAVALLLGPWVWFSYGYWIGAAAGAACVAYFFYRVSVSAATQFGELIRASFDLFRLDLLSGLGRPRPASFQEELGYWRELNSLAFYDDKCDFKLAAGAPSAAPAAPAQK